MIKFKVLLASLLSVSLLVLSSCEGPTGPSGRDGFDGRDLSSTIIFEIGGTEGINFNEGNNFSFGDIIPNDIAIDDTDLVLIYRLNEVIDGDDVWQLLPQSYFIDNNILQFNFNHTLDDFQIIVNSNFDIAELNTEQVDRFFTNQIFRIAVVRASTSSQNAAKINSANFEYNELVTDAVFLNFEK